MLVFYYQTITSTNLKRKREGNCNYKSKSNALLFLPFMHMKYGLSLLQNILSPLSWLFTALSLIIEQKPRVIIRFLITEEISVGLQMWRLSLASWGHVLHAVSSILYTDGLLCGSIKVHNYSFFSALAMLSQPPGFGCLEVSRCGIDLFQ